MCRHYVDRLCGMSVKIRIKRNRLYLDTIQNRRHHWQSLKITLSNDKKIRKEQLQLAEICRAKREMQLLCGEWEIEDKAKDKEFFAFIDEQKEKAQSKSRIKTFNSLKLYAEKYNNQNAINNPFISEINEDWVLGFKKFLQKESLLQDSSVFSYITALRTVLNAAVKEKLIKQSPAKAVKNVHFERSEKSVLSRTELCILANDIKKSESYKSAFLFACFTGLRFSDLATLQYKHIEKREINIGKCIDFEYYIKKLQLKTKHIVDIPLNKFALSLLEVGKHSNEDFVFNICYDTDLRRLKKWVASFGITKKIGFHTARRTFATLALENGSDVFTIQRLLGHTNIATTALYAKSDGTKRKAVAALDDMLFCVDTV